MKNFRYSKRLLTILLAGTISLTTTACTMRNTASTRFVSPVEAESVELDENKIVIGVCGNKSDLFRYA